MTLIVGASAHGSPGVTTALSLMASTWPGGPAPLVEADVAGGVIGARFQLAQSPGFGSLATALRYDTSFDLLDHCQAMPSGVPVVVGPTAASTALSQLRNSANSLGSFLHEHERTCLVDVGSLMPWGPMVDGLRDADLMLWFVRPVAEELRLLHTRLEEIRLSAESRIVLVGDEPYGIADVQSVFDIEVLDIVPRDDRAAAAANFGGNDRLLRRSALVRSCRSLAERSATLLGLPEVTTAKRDRSIPNNSKPEKIEKPNNSKPGKIEKIEKTEKTAQRGRERLGRKRRRDTAAATQAPGPTSAESGRQS